MAWSPLPGHFRLRIDWAGRMSNRFEHLIPKRIIKYCQSDAPEDTRRKENLTYPEVFLQALNMKRYYL